jgi:hypothetical protein
MMRWLMTGAGLMMLLLFGLTLAAEMLLPPRPVDLGADLQAFGFGACQLPCYAGIEVGETPTDQVVAVLEQHIAGRGRVQVDDLPPFESLRGDVITGEGIMYSFRRVVAGRDFNANVLARGGVVVNISLNGLIRLDAILAALGAPTCLSVSRQTSSSTLLRLMWIHDDIIVTSSVPSFQADWGMKSLTLGVQIAHLPSTQNIFIDDARLDSFSLCNPGSWLGFTQIERYQRISEGVE